VQRLRWLFTPWFLLSGLGVMLAAVLLVATHFDTFWQQLPSFQEFFHYRNLLSLWLALGIVKVLHELGHGLACKAFGGEVHDMGLLLLCLMPCLYLNVTEAWTLPDKWKRILIGLAGVYVELLIAALATFVWWNTPHQPFLHNLCLSLMVVCSVNTLLFNGNPLLRYDGYYVLADWLEVPNLRERCNTYLKRSVMKHCLGIEVPPEKPMALWRRSLFVLYAVASYLYGWLVTFAVLWFVSRFLKPYKLGAVSMGLTLAAIASMIGWPLYYLIKGIHERGRLPAMKARRATLSGSLLGLGLLLFFVLPLPISRIREAALVQPRPEAVQKVFVTLPGTLEVLHVRDGQRVEQGDVLAEFRNLELEGLWEEARCQHDVREVQVRTLRKEVAETTDPQERARLEVALTQAAGERKVFAEQVALYERRRQRLVVRAPRAGVIFGAPRREEVGKWWDRDQETPLCSIGEPSQLRVLVPITPADYRLLRQDLDPRRELAVTVRVQGWGGRTWQGRVASLPESEAQNVPLALTTRGGGPLAVKPGGRPNVLVPQSQHYLVAVDLLAAENTGIWPGTLAQVKIHCRWRTGAWWLWRTINSTFDLGLL
jgi:putative peptide zinc metalloprotease protein